MHDALIKLYNNHNQLLRRNQILEKIKSNYSLLPTDTSATRLHNYFLIDYKPLIPTLCNPSHLVNHSNFHIIKYSESLYFGQTVLNYKNGVGV